MKKLARKRRKPEGREKGGFAKEEEAKRKEELKEQ